ncbi:endonuclease/exonuclease/phosphatase family protein [Promicromonospora sukumoe]|uniref:Endonuclease/exonuclease/phosphatase family metal-dependent hydrolase n=1 Tax=Promicromonospora sukumoe TaxID=88382 RepID=A0A7W3JDJ2_9MICO|nr:endonuclease/exonuclease/phosphatase family protein [Promicromonospora sukumoe]MBA8810858.1 endonuclease/exonuclease/phosphatase family metal-dependent hydrolase [Promicromonospora sukumoe]
MSHGTAMIGAVRIATFNVQHGLGPDGRVDNDRLAGAVAALDADVVGLQEVDQGQARSGGADQAALCAEAMGAVDHRFRPALAGPFRYPGVRRRARRRERDGAPGYGIALLSRYPVLSWHAVLLPPATPWVWGRVQLGTDEPRVALAARVDAPSGPVTVVCTHLSVYKFSAVGRAAGLARRVVGYRRGTPGERQAEHQVDYLRRRLVGLPRPLVLLGDFNLRGSLPADRTGWRPLATGDTFPRHDPRFQIDHVLLDDDGPGRLGPVEGRAVDTGVSDHQALVVDLTLAGPTA